MPMGEKVRCEACLLVADRQSADGEGRIEVPLAIDRKRLKRGVPKMVRGAASACRYCVVILKLVFVKLLLAEGASAVDGVDRAGCGEKSTRKVVSPGCTLRQAGLGRRTLVSHRDGIAMADFVPFATGPDLVCR